jgi:hypothetical protein
MTIENKLPKFTAESSLFHITDFNNSYNQNTHANDSLIVSNAPVNHVNPTHQAKWGKCKLTKQPVKIEAFGTEQTCDEFNTMPFIISYTNGDIAQGCRPCPF